MDIKRRTFEFKKNDTQITMPVAPDLKMHEFGKKYGPYLLTVFIFLIIVFIWIGISWVKSDSSGKTVEESLKNQLIKDPIKTTNLANTQTSSSSQNQTTAQARQAVQNQSNIASNASSSTDTEAENSSASENEEDTEDDDTKKFESTVLKISFDYPNDVTVNEGSNLVTLTQNDKSWKIRFYDNKNKKEFEAWYKSHFDIETETDCSFADPTVKVGSYTSKLVKAASDDVECDGDGNYAINSDKSRVVKVEIGKESVENVNKILESFKFTE